MLRTLVRILVGFIAACLAAAVVKIGYVAPPSELWSLPHDAMARRLSDLGELILLTATHQAIFAAPFAIIALALAEWQRWRDLAYYAFIGVAIAITGFGLLYSSETGSQAETIVNDYAIKAFLTAGFFGGFAYWLFAGRFAGARPGSEAQAKPLQSSPASRKGEGATKPSKAPGAPVKAGAGSRLL